MPASFEHEGIIRLFRDRPSLAPEVLSGPLGVALPEHDEARVSSTDLGQIVPVSRTADLVVLLEKGRPVQGIVIEVQLRRDSRKKWSWPHYVGALRAHIRAEVVLLVVCVSQKVARWAAEPIPLGGAQSFVTPHVLGPSLVPVVTDPAQAVASPELAVLSALAHGRGERAVEVGFAAARGAASLDGDRGLIYADLVFAALDEAARRAMEELMSLGKYEYQSEFARRYYGQGLIAGETAGEAKGKVEGEAEGKAKSVVAVLRARGLEVSAEVEERVLACRDMDQLDRWLERAVTAATPEAIFGHPRDADRSTGGAKVAGK